MSLPIVILAAGESSRFYPFNTVNKSFYPLFGKPILAHTLDSIAKTPHSQVIIVTSKHFDRQALAPFIPSSLKITYVIQDQPNGQADAILSAKEYIKSGCFVLNAQHLNFHDHYPFISKHLDNPQTKVAALKIKTPHPQHYGVLQTEDDLVTAIVEKPTAQTPPSNWRLVGIYYLSSDFISTLTSIPASHYQLETALDHAAKEGQFFAATTSAPALTLKYPWDVFQLADYLLKSTPPTIAPTANIHPTAILKGDGIIIMPQAKVYEFAIIEGPAYIGADSVVGAYCTVRSGTVLEDHVTIQRYCDIKHSHFLPHSSIHSGFVGDSIVGSHTKLSAGFITANRRIDRQDIEITVKNQKINTHTSSMGAFIGPDSNLGIHSSLMPGTVIGHDSIIGPGQQLKGTFPASSKIISPIQSS